jgi:hypothetical protein
MSDNGKVGSPVRSWTRIYNRLTPGGWLDLLRVLRGLDGRGGRHRPLSDSFLRALARLAEEAVKE